MTESTTNTDTRGRGRPREFDVDTALDKAMLLFWDKGYDNVTLAELAETIGISKPSLYAAFQGKQTLFQQALARYAEGPNSFAIRAHSLPTARDVVEALLEGTVNLSSCATGPRGCLFTQATHSQDPNVRSTAADDMRRGERLLAKRFRKAKAAGELRDDTDCDALALYVKTVALGITVQGASGYSRKELQRVAAEAMHCWPAPKKKRTKSTQ